MKKTAIGIVALLTVACSAHSIVDHSKPIIAVSTLAWASIMREIAGEKSQVHIMIENSLDPHEYVPAAIDIAKLKSADIIIANGGGYDNFIMHGKTKNNIVIDAFSLRDNPANTDMHVFLNFAVVDKVSHKVARTLSGLLPDEASNFMHNYHVFHDILVAQCNKLSHYRNRTDSIAIIHTEKIGTYLLQLAGIGDITPDGIGDDDREPTAQALFNVEKMFKDHAAQGLIVNPQAENPRTKALRTIAQQYHVPIIEISEVPTHNETYPQWIDSLTQSITLAIQAHA